LDNVSNHFLVSKSVFWSYEWNRNKQPPSDCRLFVLEHKGEPQEKPRRRRGRQIKAGDSLRWVAPVWVDGKCQMICRREICDWIISLSRMVLRDSRGCLPWSKEWTGNDVFLEKMLISAAAFTFCCFTSFSRGICSPRTFEADYENSLWGKGKYWKMSLTENQCCRSIDKILCMSWK
jgi:hypothetical protein